jgi:hypothetical protein
MDLAATQDRIRVLPTVKAYPVVDHVSFSEAVCVAGITFDPPHRWVRLFPLDFRGLKRARQFKKYEVISLVAKTSTKDTRPESMTPVLDSIVPGEHLGTSNGTWKLRLPFFDAVEDDSMCAIQASQKTTRQSLGVFRPLEVYDLAVSSVPPGFEANQRAVIEQSSLLGDRAGDARNPLEPMPVKAKFKYKCAHPECKGKHEQSLIDWELGQFFRRLRDIEGKPEAECLALTRERFLAFCDDKHDMRFITGSMLSKPTSFLILGLVYPRRKQPTPPLQEHPSLF